MLDITNRVWLWPCLATPTVLLAVEPALHALPAIQPTTSADRSATPVLPTAQTAPMALLATLAILATPQMPQEIASFRGTTAAPYPTARPALS
jgi:hypothetical protein